MNNNPNRKRKPQRGSSFSKSLSTTKRKSNQSWSNLPSFVDASATVSSCIFGSRRLPELKNLYYHQHDRHHFIQQNDQAVGFHQLQRQTQRGGGNLKISSSSGSFLRSGGGKTSSRHLRRRTTSLKSRTKRHRYPRGRNDSGMMLTTKEDCHVEGNKQCEGDNDDAEAGPLKNSSKRTRRSKRNNKSTLCEPHYGWQNYKREQSRQRRNGIKQKTEETLGTVSTIRQCVRSAGNPVETVIAKSTTSHWMTTHLWHSKRFHMDKLWGWNVPMMHNNRGPRSIIRLLTSTNDENPLPKSSIQDLTWSSQPLILRCYQPLQSLISSIQRICPNINVAPAGSNLDVLCGSTTGEGVVYEVDQFPRGAIGPATWRILSNIHLHNADRAVVARSELDDGEATTGWEFHIWTHPSIRDKLKQTLQVLVAGSQHGSDGGEARCDSDPDKLIEGPFDMPGGMSRIRLRGIHSTSTLRILLPSSQRSHPPPWLWDWDALFANSSYNREGKSTLRQAVSHVPHGAIFSLQVQLDQELTKNDDVDQALSREYTNDGDPNNRQEIEVLKYKRSVEEGVSQWNPSLPLPQKWAGSLLGIQLRDFVSSDMSSPQVLFIRQRPRDPNVCHANEAICGWDILCYPDVASRIWQKLTTSRSVYHACAIGLVEDTHLMLECQPPIPVFPREYVDTKQGSLYWKGCDVEWRRVRQSWESGWGRLPIRKKLQSHNGSAAKTTSLPWNMLVRGEEESRLLEDDAENEGSGEELVVVVRGSFGQPFCDALAGCCQPPSSRALSQAKQKHQKRRNRRRAELPTDLCYATPLPKSHASGFQETCRLLRQSLTLPAVLCCHVTMVGPGNIQPGAWILCAGGTSDNTKDENGSKQGNLIGMVAGSSFSRSRGLCHGIGFLGGERFLEALEERSIGKPFAAIRRGRLPEVSTSGGKGIELVVTIDNGRYGASKQSKATVSLLL